MPVWRREPEVIEICRYFDQPERKGQWDKLSKKETQVILAELERCRSDFSYAARNYFWITSKDGEDIPFRLWESQELILEKWLWLKRTYPNRAQKLIILKARQLGCSTVIEGLIAWATIFFSNRNALVVSHTDSHAAYLFGLMLHIFDMLPWWLRPMVASRKQETQLLFANPSHERRSENPGNNSLISVQSASQVTGVGRGLRLNAVHLSEFSSFEEDKMREIIDGDLPHAIAPYGNSFAFLESTGKGAGSASHELWTAQVELGEDADWHPLFIPWFFEKTRVLAPPNGWHAEQPEMDMRDKVERDWVRCDAPKCGLYFESSFLRFSRVDRECPECGRGIMRPVILTEEQLRFMQVRRWNAQKKGEESLKKLREELAANSEEAWQLSGIQVFDQGVQQFVYNCVDNNPMIWGDIDNKGQLHWVKDPSDPVNPGKCGSEHCLADHRWDSEHPLQIWELPKPGEQYSMGVDVAEGLGGKYDYSVIWVNKFSPNGRYPDVQVAMFRTNIMDPIALASPINFIGRLFNNALCSVEVNKYDSCFNTVRLQYLYPNIFIWKHYDSKNPLSQKMGWWTNYRSKPMLWQTAVRWLRARMWIIRSSVFAEEMKRFQKDADDDVRAAAERNFHDDTLIAGMMSLFCSHDLDYCEEAEFIPVKNKERVASADWTNHCARCQWSGDSENPVRACPRCHSMLMQHHRNAVEGHLKQFDFAELGKTREELEAERA